MSILLHQERVYTHALSDQYYAERELHETQNGCWALLCRLFRRI